MDGFIRDTCNVRAWVRAGYFRTKRKCDIEIARKIDIYDI